MFWSRIGHGLAAGAASVTTLNAITYLDVALRARPSSDSPSQAVEQLAAKAGRRYRARATTAIIAWLDLGRSPESWLARPSG
jgi:hypothetical protein